MQNVFFDLGDFLAVKANANGLGGMDVEPKKPVGKSVFLQHKAMLRKLHKEQTARQVINQHWEGTWTEPFDDLEKHVKDRAPRKKKESHEEKAISEFTPHAAAERHDEIEDALWLSGCAPACRSVNCALRHRFCFLYLTSGTLRSESLCRADLSDFMGLRVPKKDNDVHPMFLMINQIPVGKTTHGCVQCGRATRHKNPKLCCVGAMAFCMQCRFCNTAEFADFTVEDWLDKESWFDVKLLVDLTGDNTTIMNNDSYSGKLKTTLQQLGLPCCDLLHLGRKLGSKLLDLLEEETREIKRMGQWADGVWENAYSSKLPFGPIRKLAGFLSKTDFYFNTRTVIKPPECLLKATPIGAWVCEAHECVRAKAIETGKAATAVQVLKFLMDLNEVTLQDAAALFVLEPDRQTHPFFLHLQVFQMEEFKAYTLQMQQAIRHEANPMDADLERVLPGAFRWHQANQQGMSALTTKVDDFIEEFRAGVKTMQATSQADREAAGREIEQRLGDAFVGIARHLTRRPQDVRTLDDDISLNDPVTEFESLLPTITQDEFESTNSRTARLNMVPKHRTLTDLWDEWHGVGRFEDQHGGVKGRETKFKNKWRKHINNAFFCRTKQCVFGIKVYADAHKMSTSDALEALQKEHVECGCSVANLMRRFQANGTLQKKGSRGRTKTD